MAAAVAAGVLWLAGGCAQAPQRDEVAGAGGVPESRATAPVAVAPKAPAGAQTVDAQRRAVLQLYMQQLLSDDAFYERTIGVQRTAPNFAAIKGGLTSIYTDPVVLDWLMAETAQGNSREQLVATIGQRSVAGFSRLDDAGALTLLNSIGGMMSRMDRMQCDRYLAPSTDRKSSFTNMAASMNGDEIRGLFEAFRLSMRADIAQQPLRTLPSGASMARVSAAIDRAQVPDAASRGSDNTCKRTARLMQAVTTLPDEDRSGGITFVLSVMGMGAQAHLNSSAKAPLPRPAPRSDAPATVRPVNAI